MDELNEVCGAVCGLMTAFALYLAWRMRRATRRLNEVVREEFPDLDTLDETDTY
jgi:hypothetical protein